MEARAAQLTLYALDGVDARATSTSRRDPSDPKKSAAWTCELTATTYRYTIHRCERLVSFKPGSLRRPPPHVAPRLRVLLAYLRHAPVVQAPVELALQATEFSGGEVLQIPFVDSVPFQAQICPVIPDEGLLFLRVLWPRSVGFRCFSLPLLARRTPSTVIVAVQY